MKIQYASDLHIEFMENRSYLSSGGIVPSAEILVLAGDISYLGDKKMTKRSFFDWCSENFRETLIVPGNHEYYRGYDIADTMEDFEMKVRDNVRYLNNRSYVVGEVELFFTTLWTKIDGFYAHAVQYGMADFRYGVYKGRRFYVSDVDEIHQRCLDWLRNSLSKSSAKHKIVVSHHCPTLRDEFNLYPGGELNSAFQVDMDDFIEGSDVGFWIYGHTHFSGGSGTTIGGTTLLCNQLGYVFGGEHGQFRKDAVLEIPDV